MKEMIWRDSWRLGFHLMPPKGWLNDPNGLCQFKGVYHVFFQYAPDHVNGGTKYWGHYTSKNLLDWTFEGISLSPDTPYDSHGVYSGSACEAEGELHLFYTGNVKLKGDYDYITDGRQGNTILTSSEDGNSFGEKNCLMTNNDYPNHLTCHVRDPKVVSGKSIGICDENYYMFLGARTKENKGEILLYQSNDLKKWVLKNILRSELNYGYMWECPDGFVLGDKKLLSVSPQGMEPQGNCYKNIYQSGYFEVVGDFQGDYQLGTFREWDRGFDFYAPQSFLDDKGRRILIGWVGMPDDETKTNPTVERGWQHALTVPREVTLQNGKVCQNPVQELMTLRQQERILPNQTWSEELSLYDAEIVTNEMENFLVSINEGLSLSYDLEKKEFSLCFSPKLNLGCGRDTRTVSLDHCSSVRILADTSCLEVYINGGEEVFTTRFYPQNGKSRFLVKQGAYKTVYWPMRAQKIIEK